MTRRRHDDKIKIALIWLALLGIARAEPETDRAELPRIPPTAPADALATFKLVPGYRLELVAAEPLVADPIAMAFDLRRRLFVVEMRGYSERRDEKLGRIRLLTDDDGDGKFDRSSLYAQGLAWPTAVIAWDGGIFVAATPDIFYIKDEDGDGIADSKQTVFTGFGAGTPRLNVQALVNNFKWGPDGRIHGATAGNGGRVQRVGKSGAPDGEVTELRGLDFSFDPATLDFRAENGGGQYGLCFDPSGRKFVCSNSDHIQQILYPRRYAGSPLPAARVGIAADGPAAEVFRISPDEPWRIVRTRWRVAGQVKGPVEGGGRVSGYFTAATGIEIHGGDAFICDAGSNLVHRKQLVIAEQGIQLVARRPDSEHEVEFLASSDNWFRPVQALSAPDGALYIADMYREVIEHPWSLPDSIKKFLDLNSGNDRGRIYRVVPDGFVQPATIDLGKLDTAGLIARLSQRDGQLAALALRQRGDGEMVAPLKTQLTSAPEWTARLRALQLLDALDALDEDTLANALSSLHPHVICRALTLIEDNAPISDRLQAKLISLGKHPSASVRYQLALTLGLLQGEWRIPVLAEIMARQGDDGWIEAAALKALGGSAGAVFDSLAHANPPPATELLTALAAMIGRAEKPEEMANLRTFADQSATQRFQLLNAVAQAGDGDETWIAERSTDALAVARDASQSNAERGAAAQFYSITGHRSQALVELFETTTIPEILDAIVASDRNGTGTEWAERIVARWDDFSPAGRVYAVGALAGDDRLPVLLKAIADKKIPAHAVDGTTVDRLRKARDPELLALVNQVFAGSAGDRGESIKTYWPALALEGDTKRGHEIYAARCLTCHRAGTEGFAFGPDIASFRSAGKELILVNLIDPDREVAPQFANHEIRLKDGSTLVGRIADQDKQQLRLRFPAGVEQVLSRENVSSAAQSPHSPMPQGLESGLSPQQMADLLAFLTGS